MIHVCCSSLVLLHLSAVCDLDIVRNELVVVVEVCSVHHVTLCDSTLCLARGCVQLELECTSYLRIEHLQL